MEMSYFSIFSVVWLFLLVFGPLKSTFSQDVEKTSGVSKVKRRSNSAFYKSAIVNRLYEEQKQYFLRNDSYRQSTQHNQHRGIFREKDFRGTYYSLSHLLINERHKLLLCPIQKVGSTLFNALFSRMEDREGWFDWSISKPGTPAWKLGIKRIEEIFQDPTWTRAIFFRNPVDRLYSAYTNFLASEYARTSYDLTVRGGVNASVSWGDFLDRVLDQGDTNIHWNPQTHFCGFFKFHRYFNFIGDFTHFKKQAEQLLRRVGIWDTYGARDWALTGLELLEGVHYTVGADNETMTYDMAAIRRDAYARLSPRAGQGDCMVCANFAQHKNTRALTNKDINARVFARIAHSKFYRADLRQLRLLLFSPAHSSNSNNNSSAALLPFSAGDLRAYHDYRAYRAAKARGSKA